MAPGQPAGLLGESPRAETGDSPLNCGESPRGGGGDSPLNCGDSPRGEMGRVPKPPGPRYNELYSLFGLIEDIGGVIVPREFHENRGATAVSTFNYGWNTSMAC